MSPRLDLDPSLLERVNKAIADIRAGRMVILVDDEDRENEGDLCMAAQFVTAEDVTFMAIHGRGLIRLTLVDDHVEKLGLPMMKSPGRGGPPLGTAFTVSIEARQGVTTGISAADRALTMRLAASPNCNPDELVTPGHVFPLKARRGGVLVRTGQTEGSVDLARLAGLNPAGVICEIMNDDGTMARLPDLEAFAKKHNVIILSIADMIRYRLQTERLVKRVAESEVRLDATQTIWRAIVYETTIGEGQILALVKGDLEGEEPALCRMHSGSILADTFASGAADGGRNLREATLAIEAEGRGVIVYLPPRESFTSELESLTRKPETKAGPRDNPLREYGLGAQVLADLGLHRLRLLTNNPRKIAGIHGFGLDVVKSVPLLAGRSAGPDSPPR